MYDIVVQHVMLGCVFTRKCTNAVIIIRKNSEKILHEPIKKKMYESRKMGHDKCRTENKSTAIEWRCGGIRPDSEK